MLFDDQNTLQRSRSSHFVSHCDHHQHGLLDTVTSNRVLMSLSVSVSLSPCRRWLVSLARLSTGTRGSSRLSRWTLVWRRPPRRLRRPSRLWSDCLPCRPEARLSLLVDDDDDDSTRELQQLSSSLPPHHHHHHDPDDDLKLRTQHSARTPTLHLLFERKLGPSRPLSSSSSFFR